MSAGSALPGAPDYGELHPRARALGVEEWVALVAESAEGQASLDGFPMPSAPPPQRQAVFHGVGGGRLAVQGAASVYRHALDACARFGVHSIRTLLDFGCGWGRFTRLFVRDVEPAGLFGCDPWAEALQMCRTHMPYGAFVKSELLPPLVFRDGYFDVVFANSVFSHLPEPNALAWITEIRRVLRPGGLLVATTHPRRMFDLVEGLRAGSVRCDSAWHQSLRDSTVDMAAARRDHEAGRFVFLETTDGKSLGKGDYGDSVVSEAYVRQVWGRFLEPLDFVDDPGRLPQATFVLRKRG